MCTYILWDCSRAQTHTHKCTQHKCMYILDNTPQQNYNCSVSGSILKIIYHFSSGVQIAATDEDTHFKWLKSFSDLGAEVLPLPEVQYTYPVNVTQKQCKMYKLTWSVYSCGSSV